VTGVLLLKAMMCHLKHDWCIVVKSPRFWLFKRLTKVVDNAHVFAFKLLSEFVGMPMILVIYSIA